MNDAIYTFSKSVRSALLGAMLGAAMTANAQVTTSTPAVSAAEYPALARMYRPPIVLDAHVDILLRLLNPKGDRSLDEAGPRGQANFENWKTGGTNAVIFAVWVDPRQFQGAMAEKRVEQMVETLHQQVKKYPDILELCDLADEVRGAVQKGKIASLIGIEGGVAINDKIENIARYRQMGVRYMTLTWRGNLAWAGSSQDLKDPFHKEQEFKLAENPSEGGLTELGRRIVGEMNRVGMIVDLSHVSDETFFDAVKVSTKPVMISHSNCRALSDHKRNVSDAMLRALKDNGGVMGINFWAELLEPNGKGSRDEGAKPVTVENVLDQIDHVVKVAGIDHVGIGTDFEGMSDLPIGLKNAAQLPKVFEGMRKRGYSEEDIRKFGGENFLRVLKANEPAN